MFSVVLSTRKNIKNIFNLYLFTRNDFVSRSFSNFNLVILCNSYCFCFRIFLFHYVTYKRADGRDSVRMTQSRFFYRYIDPQPCYKTPLPVGTTGRLRRTPRRGWKGTDLYVQWLKQ